MDNKAGFRLFSSRHVNHTRNSQWVSVLRVYLKAFPVKRRQKFWTLLHSGLLKCWGLGWRHQKENVDSNNDE